MNREGEEMADILIRLNESGRDPLTSSRCVIGALCRHCIAYK